MEGWMDENVMDVMENKKEFVNGGEKCIWEGMLLGVR